MTSQIETNHLFAGSFGKKKRALFRFLQDENSTEIEFTPKTLEQCISSEPSRLWLVYSVLTGRLPTSADVSHMKYLCEIGQTRQAILYAEKHARISSRILRNSPPVMVVTDSIFVDVHHTSRTLLATGIQKVVRETVQAWVATGRQVVLATWIKSNESYQSLNQAGAINMGVPSSSTSGLVKEEVLLVPWRSKVVLPELGIEPERTSRLLALAQFSGNSFYGLGFDCIPVTTAETVAPGMASAYSNYLSVLAHAEVVAPISLASGREFSGWKNMLPSRGISGPEIVPVVLPTVAPDGPSHDFVDTSIVPSDSPVVICVGSHEPRKNHLSVLYAAEQLWLQGEDFSLVFIGGNSWNAREFDELFERLGHKGRKLFKFSKASDGFVRAMYDRARLSVFPSLNEGFGLPLTESLACGTPCVTSNFGSMAEIAEGGGCITIDPRNVSELAFSMSRILNDDALHDQLCAEAAKRLQKNWKEYADELWTAFFG